MTLKIREIKAMSKEELTAKLEELRKELVKNQQEIAGKQSVIMEGRDITTRVLRNFKIFQFYK